MSELSTWSTAASSNSVAPPDGFPEGMLPGQLNDSSREVMAALARYYVSISGGMLGGNNGTFTLTLDEPVTLAELRGRIITVTSPRDNPGPSSLAVNSQTAVALVDQTGAPFVAGTFQNGKSYAVIYDGTNFVAFTANHGTSVDTDELVDLAVTTAKIALDAVGNDQIADDAVGADKIVDGAIGPPHLSSKAVTTVAIDDDAVGTDQIADDAVDTEQIADDAVETRQVKDASITKAKLSFDLASPLDYASPDYNVSFTLSGGTFNLLAPNLVIPADGLMKVSLGYAAGESFTASVPCAALRGLTATTPGASPSGGGYIPQVLFQVGAVTGTFFFGRTSANQLMLASSPFAIVLSPLKVWFYGA